MSYYLEYWHYWAYSQEQPKGTHEIHLERMLDNRTRACAAGRRYCGMPWGVQMTAPMSELEALNLMRDMLKSKCATLQHSHYHYPDGDDYRAKFEAALARVDRMIDKRLHPTDDGGGSHE
jgi:hypothetical protein